MAGLFDILTSLFSSAPSLLGSFGNAQDYQNAQNPLLQVLPRAGDFSGSGLGALGSLLGTAGGPIGSILGGLLGGFGGDLLGGLTSGRSSTGPGSATSDIAGASSSSDPVLALLGKGAGALGGNTPISSPDASGAFGPYFGAALGLENLLRWGPGGIGNANANKLDSETLKNFLHEQGNPGKTNDATTNGLLQAFQSGQQYLTPQNIKALFSQESPQEQSATESVLENLTGGNSQTSSTGALSSLTNAGGGSSPLSSIAPMLALLGGQILNPLSPINLPNQDEKGNKKKKKMGEIDKLTSNPALDNLLQMI